LCLINFLGFGFCVFFFFFIVFFFFFFFKKNDMVIFATWQNIHVATCRDHSGDVASRPRHPMQPHANWRVVACSDVAEKPSCHCGHVNKFRDVVIDHLATMVTWLKSQVAASLHGQSPCGSTSTMSQLTTSRHVRDVATYHVCDMSATWS